MNQIPNIEEWREKLRAIYDDLYVGHDSGYSDDIYLSSAPDYELKKLEDFIHHQLQKARQDWLREEIVRLEEEQATSDTEENGYCIAIQSVINRYQAELNRGLNQEEMVEIVEHYSNDKLMSRKANGVNILLNHSDLDQDKKDV